MFEPASKTMPAIDYVSIVSSVYKDRRAMILGALACAIGAGSCGFKTDSISLYAIAATFILNPPTPHLPYSAATLPPRHNICKDHGTSCQFHLSASPEKKFNDNLA